MGPKEWRSAKGGVVEWKKLVEREYFETDQDFVENVLPLGSVDISSFGLIADATRYALVAEGEEIHIRPEIASLKQILDSLSRGGTAVSPRDAETAVQRFAELWEERIKAKGKWEALLDFARERGEIREGKPEEKKRRGWFFRR
ncbi:hypothetical protein DRJ58_04370 [Candidatus Acetothermia bacterium]|nr:MAG: hypothetical protein DRJ27_04785 [Candidatus Acetothermia bacterium]RLE33009.1 MAG: hypothetical protein DRJ58_04370 [Candidatus Acetothermia bacterium]